MENNIDGAQNKKHGNAESIQNALSNIKNNHELEGQNQEYQGFFTARNSRNHRESLNALNNANCSLEKRE